MAIRKIIFEGDPILRKKSKKVKRIDPLTLQILDDMAETMYAAPGIGLAAPQVGINERLVVIDVGDGLLKLINPKITYFGEEKEVDTEGCLSVPGMIGDVERPIVVTLKAQGPDGKFFRIEEADGMLARCIQHELDHLDGVLYIDKAENMREVTEEEMMAAEMGELPEEIEMEIEEEEVKEEAEEAKSLILPSQEKAIFEIG